LLAFASTALPPNKRIQPTPLRGLKIVGILKADSVPSLVAIYQCGAADAQAVGRQR
jgi:hypothetical protein